MDLLLGVLLLSKINEDDACKDKHCRECYDPIDGTNPAYAVDVKKEVREPGIVGDEVSDVDKGDV